MQLQSELKRIRSHLGFDSARAFYQGHLQQKTNLDLNYSYYMKVESGRAIPSSLIISAIADSIPEDYRANLILAYCENLFPGHRSIFTQFHQNQSFKSAQNIEQDAGGLLTKQLYLTEAQISCLVRSKVHYYLFLLMTLARGPLSLEQVEKVLKSKNLGNVVSDLEATKLVACQGQFLVSYSKELKFPRAESDALKAMYNSIDQWNLRFGEEMHLERPLEKMLIRRISPRYYSLILSQLQILLDFLKAADEVQQDYNKEVVMLNISLNHGELPG